MRAIGVAFNAYVNKKIGAESMGLLTLVMSVYSFAVTVALSCVNLAAVKLTSERCAALHGTDRSSWKRAMHSVAASVCLYSLIFGVSTGIVLYFSSGVISERVLADMRTLPSLRVLALSLPAISLSSALSGFFTGLRKVRKNAVVALSEQFLKIAVTSASLVLIFPGSVERSCLAVVGGSAVSEAFSLVLNILMFITDTKMPDGEIEGKSTLSVGTSLGDTVKISLPSAIGAYARQGLTTLEHIAIPRGVVKSGLTESAALAEYGLLQGIAFPLVMFPYAVIGSFTSLLVPEMAELSALGDHGKIRALTEDVYRYSAMFSLLAAGIFSTFSEELGILVYSSRDAAGYTLALGLLVPFMYLDTAVDSLLKGLGEQVYIMYVNIADAAAGLLFVVLLTPLWGIKGYIVTMWICEVGNLTASIIRLGIRTGAGIESALGKYVIPVVAAGSMSILRLTVGRRVPAIAAILLYSAGYAAICILHNGKLRRGKSEICKVSGVAISIAHQKSEK